MTLEAANGDRFDEFPRPKVVERGPNAIGWLAKLRGDLLVRERFVLREQREDRPLHRAITLDG